MNRGIFPGLTMSTALTGNFSAGVSGNSETMHTGFSVHVLHYANAPVRDTEETGRYDLAWKDLWCSEC